MDIKKIANGVEEIRRRVHQIAEGKLATFAISVVFYGALTMSVVGIIVILLAWVLSDPK